MEYNLSLIPTYLTQPLHEVIQAGNPADIACTAIAGIGVAIAGACIGSFYTVLCSRRGIPFRKQKTRSECPRCHKQLGMTENIPIIGWLILQGRCKGCGTQIPARYILSELAHALLWTLPLSFTGPLWASLIGITLSTLTLPLQKLLWKKNKLTLPLQKLLWTKNK